jgi:hypothetical protein
VEKPKLNGIAKTILKMKKFKNSHYLVLRLTINLQYSRVCDTGKKRHADQWNRTEDPEIGPCIEFSQKYKD